LAREFPCLGFPDGVEVVGDLAHVLDRQITPSADAEIAPVKRNPVAQGFNSIWHRCVASGA
jgi:hypothetical protein